MTDFDPKAMNGLIDQLLDEHRPDRYEPGISDNWIGEQVAPALTGLIPTEQVRQMYAEEIAKKRESLKTRRSNALLREIYETRQLPLDWLELSSLPISVGKERVALRAATASDFEMSAIDERRSAAQEFSARSDACDAKEWVADQMRTIGAKRGEHYLPTIETD